MAQAERLTRTEFWWGVSAFIVIVAVLALGGYWLLTILYDEEQLSITGMILQGDRQYITEQEVVEALLAEPMGSFFTADADDLRQRLEALPWVYSASVRKEWPRRLRLYLVEQVPVASWNTRSILNKQGEVVAAHPSRVNARLPLLEGPEKSALEVFESYQKAQALLNEQSFVIERFVMSERFSVSFWLTNGIEVRLGREALLQRIQRFMDLLPLIEKEREELAKQLGKPQEMAIAYIDLRYDTGVAVGWHQGMSDEKSDRKN